ncbi:MAG: hypothetical protein QM831_44005 [Kofleriaceae bacterium]
MIAIPLNDHTCLEAISRAMRDLVDERDPAIVEIADRFKTTEQLAAWIRSLPQRDDEGDPTDGPRVEACTPTQRLVVPSTKPNCVERTALYLAGAEIIDPIPVRQMATIETEWGSHTLPLENGAPIVLDPRMTRNAAACGVAMAAPGPVAVEAIDAIEWSAELAAGTAVKTNVRNGPSKIRRARNAVVRLVDQHAVPEQNEVDLIGWMFALAERAAQRYGARALTMVRAAARAVSEILDDVLGRMQRNLSIDIGGTRFTAPRWLEQVGSAAGHIGLDIGAAALRAKLAALGVTGDLVGLVEDELNHEGLTLGVLAHPPHLSMFGGSHDNS